MSSIVLYFHVHQPFRLKQYTFFDIAREPDYFDDAMNAAIVRRVAERCYLPMNALLLRLADRHGDRFRCAMSVTGTALEQMGLWAPRALESFRELARTGCVEFVSETSHHSLAFLANEDEFRAQVRDHTARLERTFGVRPKAFRNTELVIDELVARVAADLGFDVLLGEGADHLVGWRSPTSVYRAAGTERLSVLLRSYKFSDDIAFRFSNRGWSEWPLSAEKFARWLKDVPGDTQQIGLFMDYETAGEHQWEETGIFEFMESMPGAVLGDGRFTFRTPTEVALAEPATETLEIPHPVSWADAERDLSAWLGNPMQSAAHGALYALYDDVRSAAERGRPELLETWRKLSTSDHVYYMCTKGASDGEVHAHFSPYESPHHAHVRFMNVLDDLARRLAVESGPGKVEDPDVTLFEISWEVAHRVGGIHTVVATKARSLVERYGDDYVVVGPWLLDQHDPDAVLDPAHGYGDFEEDCRREGLPVRVGRWRVPGRPLTILVEFSGLYERKDEVLTELWKRCGVDSLRGDWGYVEPVLFGHAAGMVVERWWRDVVAGAHRVAVAQAHEWMTGSALLYLTSHVPEIGTVFTAHATALGRSAAAEGRIGDAVLDGGTPEAAAAAFRVPAKHSMESVTARSADVFTAVSDIASAEAERFLGRAADPVLPNGLDREVLAARVGDVSRERASSALRDLAARFLGESVGDAAIVCSGARYEFHNKGLDILIDAAGAMNRREGRPVVLFLLVPAGNSGLTRSVSERLAAAEPPAGPPLGIALQNLFEPEQDPIAVRCAEAGLDNAHGTRVRVIHWAEYLAPDDGILGLRYEAALQGADATSFPSFYETWGYTPQESLALGVPTVTTDLAGFGRWALAHGFGPEHGVHVLRREGRPAGEITDDLEEILERLVAGPADPEGLAEACRTVAAATYWPRLISAYEEAHGKALEAAGERVGSTGGTAPRFRVPVRPSAQNGRPHVFALDVPTVVPRELEALTELADNWWWSWDAEATRLFREICPDTWDHVHHAPVRLLRDASTERLRELAADAEYVDRANAARERFAAYMDAPLDEREVTRERPVGYVCAEFGLHESFPVYSGGLGVLAGDHLRAASDLGVPLVAVGLFYRAGYMRQKLRGGVEQQVLPERVDPRDLPLSLVLDADGEPVEIVLRMPGSEPVFRVWRTDVGRVPVYLLDADVSVNRAEDRELTRALYSGDERMRIRQDIVLGIGGVRLLRRLGIEPSVFHINEGHGAFASLERVRGILRDTGLTFEEAREVVRSTTVFTTHTPVPAGHDEFPEELVRRYFGDEDRWAGVPWERFMALGSSREAPDRFNMTGLAVRFASRVNGVSVKHAEVSRGLLRRYSPQLLADEMPVHAVTNGVHLGLWTQPAVADALGGEPGAGLAERFAAAEALDDARVWELRQSLRALMRERLVAHLRRTFAEQGDSPTLLDIIESELRSDALYVGFARRFATYKRADLIFRDPERLLSLLTHVDRPVRLLVAGKAHPRDTEAQEMISRIGRLSRDPRFLGRLVLIENYDMGVARWLLGGVDVWLNNPRPPMEASGTSGMKAAANGALNLSVGDGWWLEGYDGRNGWRIGAAEGVVGRVHVHGGVPGEAAAPELQDARDAASLYGLLEHEVIPAFFERDGDGDGVPRRWTALVRRGLATIPPEFSAARMVGDYRSWAYEPLAAVHAGLAPDRYGAAPEAFGDLLRVRRTLPSVRIVRATVGDVRDLVPGGVLAIGVDVALGESAPDDVRVEALVGRRTDDGELRGIDTVELAVGGEDEDGHRRYSGELTVRSSGAFGYAVRVRPARPGGPAFDDPVVWA